MVRGSHLVAALLYLGLALLWYRAVLPDPRSTLPYPATLDEARPQTANLTALDHADQSMVLATVIRNAHSLLTHPMGPLEDGQCFPTPRSHTLGEHMFGCGLVAAPIYALSGDPILTYNGMLVARLWIAAMAMYALALYFTGSGPAAFVAGAILALAPVRILDPAHPYVHGDLWLPLVLLFSHRVFARGGIGDALGLALFSCLVITESLYTVLGAGIVGGVYMSWLAVQYRTRLRSSWRLLLPALVAVLAVATIVFTPYLETRSAWDVLGGRVSLRSTVAKFGFGRLYFPGVIVLGLAALGWADRARRKRPVSGSDPRVGLSIAGFVLVWCALGPLPLPGTSLEVPSPLALVQRAIPGLDAVRGLEASINAITVPLALIASYGVVLLGEALGSRRRIAAPAMAATLVLAMFGMRAYGPTARASFGKVLKLRAWLAVPPAEEIALVHRAEGARLDLPLAYEDGAPSRIRVADHLLLGSYAPGPTAVCYNSFITPVQEQVAALGAQLPAAPAADALAALGFRTVFGHLRRWADAKRTSFLKTLTEPGSPDRLRRIDETDRILALELSPPTSIGTDFSLLAGGRPDGASLPLRAPKTIPFSFRNRTDTVFRHPEPLEPSGLRVRVFDEDDRLVREFDTRALLPIALAPGGDLTIPIDLPVPLEAGRYRAEVARSAEPTVALGWARFESTPGASVTTRTPAHAASP